ncbi:MAG: hypothetical protein IPJ90_19445 [Anaerolineaceae bacterium]|nr:hypothetical protein [Anaerolineaceae bacterium]
MSQEELRITMLGGYDLAWGDGRTQKNFTNDLPDKPRALLGYLVLNGRLHRRDKIANIFWPDSQDPFASLRVALNRLRSVGLEPFLHISRTHVGFNQNAPHWFDVQTFEILIANSRRQVAPDIATLKKAVSLYKGGFLAEFSLPDITAFDDDIIVLRQQYEDTVWEALETIIHASMQETADYEIGMQYARRALALMPWREAAHRYLMWFLAHTGQKAAAIIQYERCREALKKHVDDEPSPETEELLLEIRQHKNTAELEKVILPPLGGTPEADAPPFLAAGQRPYFVGRTQSITRLEQLLTETRQAPRVAIVGMGGIGKTTLALHLAHKLRPYFPDGVLWANLVEAQPEDIAIQWAAAYGYDLSQQRSGDERLSWLRQLLASKQALLIFDGVRTGASIRRLLPDEGQCAVLLTSRAERVVRSVDAQAVPLAQLALENGRRLLLHHVQDDRAIAEPDALDEICQLVGNHPLAINIAGSYLAYRPYRSLAGFAAMLGERIAPLNLTEDAERLRETFALSWTHLEEGYREIFCLMGLFDGRSFSLAAIAALANVSLNSQEQVYQFEDRLQTLAQLSLLQDEGGQRYRQHSLLASFALEKLADTAVPQARYIAYFADFAAEHATHYARLQLEWGNLDTAVHFAQRAQQWETVLNFTAVLKDAWFTRARFEQARQAFERAFQAAIHLEDDSRLARNWLWWGQACLEQGDQAEARQWLQKALDLYDELEDGIGIADAEFALARLDIDQTLPTEAERRLDRVLALRQAQGDAAGVAATQYRYARLWHRELDDAKALTFAEQALAGQAARRDELGRCRTLRLLVFIMIGLNQREMAYQYATESLALAETLPDLGELAMAQRGVASAARLLGRLEEAKTMANQSYDNLAQMGDRRSMNDLLFLHGLIKRSEGKFAEAIPLFNGCLREFTRLKDELHVTYCLVHLGDYQKELGELQTAVQYWQEALELAVKLGKQPVIDKINGRLQPTV